MLKELRGTCYHGNQYVAMATKKGSFVDQLGILKLGSFVDQFGTYDHGIFNERSNVWREKDCWVPVTMETDLLPW